MSESLPHIPNSLKKFESAGGPGGGTTPDPDRIDGPDGERWPKWLVERRDELDQVTNPQLKMEIRLLARRSDLMTTPDVLQKAYARIDEMVSRGEIGIPDAAFWQARISARLEELITAGSEESLHPVPRYFEAVFRHGSNEAYVKRRDLTATLDLEKTEDRRKFIFLNLHAFNYRWNNKDVWSGALDDWENDAKLAREALDKRGIRVSTEDFEDEFLKKMEAGMAVTAAARAMEASGGNYKAYAVHLLGADGKGDPVTDNQDAMGSLLLTTDPDKLITVLNDPLVQKYYRLLMQDAGLVFDADHEWHGGKPRRLEFNKSMGDVKNGELCRYLKGMAKDGGMQKYIEGRLLPSDSPADLDRAQREGITENMRIAAAKLAVDAFLVDKYSEWSWEVTNRGNEEKGKELKLQPQSDWGGDPLGSILRASTLPRIKHVYDGEQLTLLDEMDVMVRPEDIFDEVQTKYAGWKDVEKVRPEVASLVMNTKTVLRLSDFIYKMSGGALANGLADFSPKNQGEIVEMANLVHQVYGAFEITNPDNGEVLPIGRHIEAYIMLGALLVKSKAAVMESATSAGDTLTAALNPTDRGRALLDALSFLFGPELKMGKSGFIYSIEATRHQMVIKNNMFGAEKMKKEIYDILSTNNLKGGRYAGLARGLGKAIRIGAALGDLNKH